MDEDVNKAIKQLETIAIKAINSGYLDDAAKVMHIAEEIERVDKSGLASESKSMEDTSGVASEFDSADNFGTVCESKDVDGLGANAPRVRSASVADVAVDAVVSEAAQDPTIRAAVDLDPDSGLSAEAREALAKAREALPEELGAPVKENVISLNKLRMKRGAAMRQKSKGTPSTKK